MAFNYDLNPFKEIPTQPVPESSRMRKSSESKHETFHAKPELEHIVTMYDLQAYLEVARTKLRDKPRERQNLTEACDGIIGCDPWKYEPFLVDELFKARGGGDAVATKKLRGLIRAGSWMSYPRQSTTEVLDDIAKVRNAEQRDWEWRLRNADPDTAKEIRENRAEQQAEFTELEHAVSQGLAGDDLEPHVRNIEDLLGHAWYSLKKLMAANGLDWRQAESHPATSHAFKEIENLRPLRDYVYFRLLYPKWAEFSKTENSKRKLTP